MARPGESLSGDPEDVCTFIKVSAKEKSDLHQSEVSKERLAKLGRSVRLSTPERVRNIPTVMSAQFESSESDEDGEKFEPLYIPASFKKTRKERVND